jgi:hypothetical protein
MAMCACVKSAVGIKPRIDEDAPSGDNPSHVALDFNYDLLLELPASEATVRFLRRKVIHMARLEPYSLTRRRT